MKKLLSMLLAVAMIMTVGVTAFAEDTTTYYFVFGADKSTDATLESLLEPGTEYKFGATLMSKTGDQEAIAVENYDLDDYRFTYSKTNASGMNTFEIKEQKDGSLALVVEAKKSANTKETDVKYTVKVKAKNQDVTPDISVNQEVKFTYGYAQMDGDYIGWLDKGDTVEIDNSNPVITASQFNKIAKANDYKNVTLSGAAWNFVVNVTDETSKNMISNNAGVKDILAKFSDQDFKFFNFPGTPTFSATGRMELDVEDLVDDFSKMYVYRYANGVLYKINASFDSEENLLSFRTNTLDTFLVTNKAIDDGTVVTDNGQDTTPPATEKPDNNGKPNPGMGAMEIA